MTDGRCPPLIRNNVRCGRLNGGGIVRLNSFLVAGTVFLLAFSLAGCAASVSTQRDAADLVPVESSSELVHPPYVDGLGSVSGTLVRSTVSTYPAGSLQKLIPFPAVVVRWESGDLAGESEFLVNGFAELVLDGALESLATCERISDVLDSAAPGTAIQIEYEGSDLTPGVYEEPPADFPYAFVMKLTIDTSK